MDVNRTLRMLTTTGLVIVALLLAYVLSYAPYIRYRYGPPIVNDSCAMVSWDLDHPYFSHTTHPPYGMVEWLIDHSRLRKPLLPWSRLWNAENKVWRDSYSRTLSGMLPDTWEELREEVRSRRAAAQLDDSR